MNLSEIIAGISKRTPEEVAVSEYFKSLQQGVITPDLLWHEDVIDALEKIMTARQVAEIIFNGYAVLEHKSLLVFASIIKKRYGIEHLHNHKNHKDIIKILARYLV